MQSVHTVVVFFFGRLPITDPIPRIDHNNKASKYDTQDYIIATYYRNHYIIAQCITEYSIHVELVHVYTVYII